jgi:hypothetical protein
MNEYTNLRIGNRLLWRAAAIAGLVFAGIGLAGVISEWMVAAGIQWVSISNVGTMVTGIWIVLSAGIAEFLTDRVFKHISVGKEDD